ncbi:MAG: hypothetical protein Fur0034_21760 [Desulfuromonadia bacterium]
MSPTRTVLCVGNDHSPVLPPESPLPLARFTFAKGPEELSTDSILDCTFATPARYVRELFRRSSLLAPHGTTPDRIIINPLLEPSGDLFDHLLPRLETLSLRSPFILSDSTDMPVVYGLPTSIPPMEGKFFSLLSTVNTPLDRELLETFFGGEWQIIPIDGDLRTFRGNGFNRNRSLEAVWEWTASSAITLLKRHLSRSPSLCTPAGRQRLRHSIPIVGFIPYHAGDILFYALASRTGGKDLSGIAINTRFTDIIDDILPRYDRECLTLSPPRHQPGDPSDEEYFFSCIDQLSPFRFHYYCRPSRDYAATSFNLIDHFAFAQGDGPVTRGDLATAHLSPPPRHPIPPSPPIRILLHFDAGWPLKVYPRHYQKRLIQQLLSRGLEITVLGTENRQRGGYRTVRFTTLAALRELIASHHLIVGSDSFPCHYAAYVMGVPTIHLFGPTRQEISSPPSTIISISRERRLGCRPCTHIEICRPKNQRWCDNFTPPDQLLSDILAMLPRTLPAT